MLMRDVPLASILLDDGNIVIGTARDREHTDHVVPNPATMCVERTPEGADKQLEIIARDGGTVRVRFRTAIRPELVDFDALLAGIGEARVVLLGEATHGTHEFYRLRALITRLERGPLWETEEMADTFPTGL